MTTIGYRDGVLASDSLLSDGNGLILGRVDKIWRSTTGAIAGLAGNPMGAERFRDWFLAGGEGELPDLGRSDGMIIYSDQRIVAVSQGDRGLAGVFTVVSPYYSAGSGEEISLGAMWAGATAREAVKAAIQLSRGSGPPIKALRLG